MAMAEPLNFEDWKKISTLGSGAFGEVSLWKNEKNNEFVAIKKCKFAIAKNISAKQKERWHNEVAIMKTLNNQNIVSFKELPPDLHAFLLKYNPSQLPLLSMEYCTKGSLRNKLREPKNWCGLEEQDVRCILEDVSSGLSYLHDFNITHRDLKPDNIVLQHCDNRVGNTVYKIIDLGYAKELRDTVISFVGTLHYLAPEIFESEQYTKSVDYWSMGILTFEIICGVLPFLPHLSPPQRFEYLKKKQPEHICIFKSLAGSIEYSPYIRKESQISSCLKHFIETWLRRVLQYDQSKRSELFENNLNVFQKLQSVLTKRIVHIFSVYKLEHYSYEISESTLISTLKDWIYRDTKVPRYDQILLADGNLLDFDDDMTIMNVLDNNDSTIYLLKRSILVTKDLKYNIPKLVKLLFEGKDIQNDQLKLISAQTIHYISWEKKLVTALSKAFVLYVNHMHKMVEKAKKRSSQISEQVLTLIEKVKEINLFRKNNVCDFVPNETKKYVDCLVRCQRLIASLDRTTNNSNLLAKKINILVHRKEFLCKNMTAILNYFNGCDIEKYFVEAIQIVEKLIGNPKGIAELCDTLHRIVSNTIKDKDKLLNRKCVLNYHELVTSVLHSAEILIIWMNKYEKHIAELSAAIQANEKERYQMAIRASNNNKKKSVMVNGDLTMDSADHLVDENKNLLQQYNDWLDSSLAKHEDFVKNINQVFTL